MTNKKNFIDKIIIYVAFIFFMLFVFGLTNNVVNFSSLMSYSIGVFVGVLSVWLLHLLDFEYPNTKLINDREEINTGKIALYNNIPEIIKKIEQQKDTSGTSDNKS